MKRILLILVSICLLNILAWTNTTHLRINFKDSPAVIYPLSAIDSITYSAESDGEMSHININMGATTKRFALDSINNCKLTCDIPVINMLTDDKITDINDKLTWHPGTLSVTPNGYPDMDELSDATFQLRGRGNSTLKYPKKPYRIKFESKTPLHSSLRKAKNYALIANYIDPTNMRNTVAFEIARSLELPYTNHSIPVWVTLNGRDKGLYMLTEKIGLNSGSVHDIDEAEGILFEIDTAFDEDYKFYSDSYTLPVMVKDPDLAELQEKGVIADADTCLDLWKQDFSRLETRIKKGDIGGSLWDLLDMTTTVNYLLVYNLTRNTELHYPKSLFLHKHELSDSAKYAFGPVWDFDWAFTFDFYDGWGRADDYLFNTSGAGTELFRDIIRRNDFQKAFARTWTDFYNGGKLDEILDFIDSYAAIIQPAADRDNSLWPPYFSDPGVTFTESVDNLKQWIRTRAEYINTADNFGFFANPDSLLSSIAEWDSTLTTLLPHLASISVSDPAANEGHGLLALFDDNPATYYQSQSADNCRHDSIYGSYVDFQFIDSISAVQLLMRLHPQYLDHYPDQFTLYTSNDAIDWTELTTVSDIHQMITTTHPDPHFGCFRSSTPFKHLRFAVTRTKNDTLTETSTDTIPTFWTCTDLLLFGH